MYGCGECMFERDETIWLNEMNTTKRGANKETRHNYKDFNLLNHFRSQSASNANFESMIFK